MVSHLIGRKDNPSHSFPLSQQCRRREALCTRPLRPYPILNGIGWLAAYSQQAQRVDSASHQPLTLKRYSLNSDRNPPLGRI